MVATTNANSLPASGPRFSANGHNETEPLQPANTLDLLSRITPAEVQRATEANEAEFAAAKDKYTRQRKLLRMLSGGLGVHRAGKAKKPKTDETDKHDDAIVALLVEFGPLARDTVSEKCELAKNATTAKLKKLIRLGKVKEADGKFAAA